MGIWRKIRNFCGTQNLKISPATPRKNPSEDVMKLVFRYLICRRHLGRCMLVCKLWRDILSKDEYMAKCLIMQYYPALCKPGSGVSNFRQLYRTLFPKTYQMENTSPRLSANDLEFYLDIWSDDQSLILSRAAPMQTLKGNGAYWSPPPGIRVSDPVIMPHLQSKSCYEFKLILLLKPRLTIRRPGSIIVSLLVGERGSDRVACLIKKSESAVDPETSVAVASGELCFSPDYPYVAPSRAWIGLVFDQEIKRDEGMVDVFRIEFGFYHVPDDISADPDRSRRLYIRPPHEFVSTEENVLKLLGMLEWK